MLLAACTNDPTEDIVDVAPGTLPEGTFVIDYTASTGDASTRATAAERIRSLDYLLYESTDGITFTLKHRRSIPDIGETTVWPLSRETMTWEQRQALKDTLNTACQYKMVFVANADKSIWSNTEVLENVAVGSTFDEGRLVLPPRVFTENDMYYMWSNHDTPLMGNEYNKDNPAQMDITLQRMINKVEVKLDDKVVNGIASAGSVSNYVTSFLSDYYETFYVKNDNSGQLDKIVWAYMDQIAEKITYNDGIGSNREDRSQKAFETKFINPDEKRKAVVQSINECESGCTPDNYCVKHQFITEMKEYFAKRCDWSQITNLTLSYTTLYASAITFNKDTEAKADATTINVERDTEGHYIFYTFGNKENSNINTISSISFKTSDNQEIFNAECNTIPGNGTVSGNNHFLLTYSPTSQANIESDSELYFQFTRKEYNIQNVLNWSWDDSDFEYSSDIINTGWKKFKMIQWVNSLFSGSSNQDTFVPYTLTLNIPKVKIIHPWTTSLIQ